MPCKEKNADASGGKQKTTVYSVMILLSLDHYVINIVNITLLSLNYIFKTISLFKCRTKNIVDVSFCLDGEKGWCVIKNLDKIKNTCLKNRMKR